MSSSYDPNPYESPRTRSESVIPATGENGAHVFRDRLFTVWWLVMRLSLVIATPVFVPFVALMEWKFGTLWLNHRVTDGLCVIAAAHAFLLVAMSVTVCVVVTLCPTYVSDLGIRAPDSWLRYHYVAWSDITKVTPSNVLGMRGFRVYANGLRGYVYLSFYMAKPKLFWPYLLTLLPPDSPLAKAIREARLAER